MKNSLLILLSMFSLMISAQDLYLHCGKLIDTENGADNIKITATGGVLSVAKNGQNPQFTLEEVQAICETAKDYGMIIAAHAHGDEGMERAVIGGVTTIEHGTKMSEKTMDLMK